MDQQKDQETKKQPMVYICGGNDLISIHMLIFSLHNNHCM